VVTDTTITLCALFAGLLALGAEALHARRVRKVARLAFGPRERPAAWARCAPLVRGASFALLTFGLLTLMSIEPRAHTGAEHRKLPEGEYRHVLIVLDVSPSMRLVDAGPEHVQSRMQRARDVLSSFFKRVPLDQFRISVVAVYNGAKPVVIDTSDMEVVQNVLGDLPMHYAFKAGKTRIFDGLEEAARIAKPWNPGSTTLILVSDGDTVPAKGMPTLPASVSDVLVVGVGDPLTGKFIDGRQSRQDVSTLRQIAARLRGVFHNGNERHLSTLLIGDLTNAGAPSPLDALTRREYALLACALGALLLALLPLALHYLGSAWRPGMRPGQQASRWSLDSPVGSGRRWFQRGHALVSRTTSGETR